MTDIHRALLELPKSAVKRDRMKLQRGALVLAQDEAHEGDECEEGGIFVDGQCEGRHHKSGRAHQRRQRIGIGCQAAVRHHRKPFVHEKWRVGADLDTPGFLGKVIVTRDAVQPNADPWMEKLLEGKD